MGHHDSLTVKDTCMHGACNFYQSSYIPQIYMPINVSHKHVATEFLKTVARLLRIVAAIE